jgi:hypothetical protein
MGWNSKHHTKVNPTGDTYTFTCTCGASGSHRTKHRASTAARDHRTAGVRRVLKR